MFGRLALVALAAGFVLVTWTVMFLGRFQQRHFNPEPAGST